jgi:subtilisin family serine protease
MIFKSQGVLALLLLAASMVIAQEHSRKCWIYFRDKDERMLRTLAKGVSAAEISRASGISERALARRAKVLPHDRIISSEDLPVSPQYVDQLEHASISIINTSRWFNAVTAMITNEQRKQIASLSFVERVEPVRIFIKKELPPSQIPFLDKISTPAIQQLHDYGASLTQVSQIKVVDVHNLRITGRGVLVGMLDSGFRWRIPEATKNMNVVGEYDFIQHDTVTANESGKTPVDASDQDGHGTITLSTVGGYKEGQLVGPAFGASFILAKTEYVPSETNIEEDNWVAGIEWEEQNGVDVVSSSLGYSEFDAGQKSYTYADMNGRTATTSKAAVLAARRGVVVCSAMGNEGATGWHYLTSPADADSIISVGAVNSSGVLASFSSVGPTSDGRTKPDVVAQGVATYAATASSTSYGFFGGTSLSTPLVAGAAALVLSAHPELTPIQVREALRSTASNASSPNNTIGWGIINTYRAILYYGMVLSTDPEITITPDIHVRIGVFVVSDAPIRRDSVLLYYSTNGSATFTPLPMTLTDIVDSSTNSGKYSAIIPNLTGGIAINFYVYAVDATNKSRVSPHVAATPPVPATFALYQNFPNPFNSSSSIQYILERANYTTLKIYDVLGREVATLVNEYQSPGVKPPVYFDASRFASGVYLYRLKSGEFSAVKKLVLLK